MMHAKKRVMQASLDNIRQVEIQNFVGAAIANLHSSLLDEIGSPQLGIDKSHLVRAARQLLSSVTRVLLLADRVLVSYILRAEDKIAYSLTLLENTSNFSMIICFFTYLDKQLSLQPSLFASLLNSARL